MVISCPQASDCTEGIMDTGQIQLQENNSSDMKNNKELSLFPHCCVEAFGFAM